MSIPHTSDSNVPRLLRLAARRLREITFAASRPHVNPIHRLRVTKWKLFLLMHGDLTGRLYNIFVCLRGPVNPMGTFLDSILERVTELFEELVVNKLLIGFRIALVEHRGGNSCIIFGIVHVVTAMHPAHATHDGSAVEKLNAMNKRKKALIPTPFNSPALRIFLYFSETRARRRCADTRQPFVSETTLYGYGL